MTHTWRQMYCWTHSLSFSCSSKQPEQIVNNRPNSFLVFCSWTFCNFCKNDRLLQCHQEPRSQWLWTSSHSRRKAGQALGWRSSQMPCGQPIFVLHASTTTEGLFISLIWLGNLLDHLEVDCQLSNKVLCTVNVVFGQTFHIEFVDVLWRFCNEDYSQIEMVYWKDTLLLEDNVTTRIIMTITRTTPPTIIQKREDDWFFWSGGTCPFCDGAL